MKICISNSKCKKCIKRALSALLALVFLLNTIFADLIYAAQPSAANNHTLAITPLSLRADPAKVDALFALYRKSRLIWDAGENPRYLDMLARHHAPAVPLDTGHYLTSSALKYAETDEARLALVRAITRADFTVLMEREARLHTERYANLIRALQSDAALHAAYLKLVPAMADEPDEKTRFNDLLARAFELYTLTDPSEPVIERSSLPSAEREFLDGMAPYITAREKYFSAEFFDRELRMQCVLNMQEDTARKNKITSRPETDTVNGATAFVDRMGKSGTSIEPTPERYRYTPVSQEDVEALCAEIAGELAKNIGGYLSCFVQAARRNNMIDIQLSEADIGLKAAKIASELTSRMHHEGIVKDEGGLWIIKKLTYQGEDRAGRMSRAMKNFPKCEMLAHLLTKGRANLTEIRFITQKEAVGIDCIKGDARDYYLSHIVASSNRNRMQLSHTVRGDASSAIFVANILMRKWDHHLGNVGYIHDVPVAIDHDETFRYGKYSNDDEGFDRFICDFLRNAVFSVVDAVGAGDPEGHYWRDRQEICNIIQKQSERVDFLSMRSIMQTMCSDFGLGKGFIAAEGLDVEKISRSIREFKSIVQVRDLAVAAGYADEDLDAVVRFIQENQRNLGRDVDAIWQALTDEKAGFEELDREAVGQGLSPGRPAAPSAPPESPGLRIVQRTRGDGTVTVERAPERPHEMRRRVRATRGVRTTAHDGGQRATTAHPQNLLDLVIRICDGYEDVSRSAMRARKSDDDTARAVAAFASPIIASSGFPAPQDFFDNLISFYREYVKLLRLPKGVKHAAMQNLENVRKIVLNGLALPQEKEDAFLRDFYANHKFIDTDTLDLRSGETVTPREMIRRYAEKFPGKLIDNDPETVLALVREENGMVILKPGFGRKYPGGQNKKIGRGERFCILYEYPRYRATEKAALTPDDSTVRLSDLTPRALGKIDKIFDRLGHRIYAMKNEAQRRGIVKRWVDKQTAKLPPLVLARGVFLYCDRTFSGLPHEASIKWKDREPYNRKCDAAYRVLEYLAANEDVADWMRQLVIATYLSGDYATRESKRSQLTSDFQILLSILIRHKDEAILPIAIHALFECEYEADTSGDLIYDNGVVQRALAMWGHDDAIKASLVASLTLYPFTFFLPSTEAFMASVGARDFLFKDVLPYCMYTNDPAKNFSLAHKISSDEKLLNAIMQFHGTAVMEEVYRLLSGEKNARVAQRAFQLFIASRMHNPEARRDDVLDRSCIDSCINILQRHRLSLRGTTSFSKDFLLGLLTENTQYRRPKVVELLTSLLNDPARDDIGDILNLLDRVYHEPAGQEAVVKHYLDPASSFFDAALAYMIAMKSPAYFGRVWDAVDAADAAGKIDADKAAVIGAYAVAMLEAAERGEVAGMDEAERGRIAAFANAHIFATPLADAKKTVTPWIDLAGLLGRDDLYDQVAPFLEQEKVYSEHLKALFRFTRDDAAESLRTACLTLLTAGEKGFAVLRRFLDRIETGYAREKKRPIFNELLDAATLNQLKPAFDRIIMVYVHRDGEGAAAYLRAHQDVDVSGIELLRTYTSDDSGNCESEKAPRFVARAVRDQLVSRHIKCLSRVNNLTALKLIDDESKAAERMREDLANILYHDLELTYRQVKDPVIADGSSVTRPWTMSDVLKALSWDGEIENDWIFTALLALKPVNDLRLADIDLDRVTKPEELLRTLIARDPAFYEPLSEKMQACLAWLGEKDILKGKSETLLDRFVAYFLNEDLRDKPKTALEYRAIDRGRANGFMAFLKSTIVPDFYPCGCKKEIKTDASCATFIRALAALWLKDIEQRTREARPTLFALPAPSDAQSGTLPGRPAALLSQLAVSGVAKRSIELADESGQVEARNFTKVSQRTIERELTVLRRLGLVRTIYSGSQRAYLLADWLHYVDIDDLIRACPGLNKASPDTADYPWLEANIIRYRDEHVYQAPHGEFYPIVNPSTRKVSRKEINGIYIEVRKAEETGSDDKFTRTQVIIDYDDYHGEQFHLYLPLSLPVRDIRNKICAIIRHMIRHKIHDVPYAAVVKRHLAQCYIVNKDARYPARISDVIKDVRDRPTGLEGPGTPSAGQPPDSAAGISAARATGTQNENSRVPTQEDFENHLIWRISQDGPSRLVRPLNRSEAQKRDLIERYQAQFDLLVGLRMPLSALKCMPDLLKVTVEELRHRWSGLTGIGEDQLGISEDAVRKNPILLHSDFEGTTLVKWRNLTGSQAGQLGIPPEKVRANIRLLLSDFDGSIYPNWISLTEQLGIPPKALRDCSYLLLPDFNNIILPRWNCLTGTLLIPADKVLGSLELLSHDFDAVIHPAWTGLTEQLGFSEKMLRRYPRILCYDFQGTILPNWRGLTEQLQIPADNIRKRPLILAPDFRTVIFPRWRHLTGKNKGQMGISENAVRNNLRVLELDFKSNVFPTYYYLVKVSKVKFSYLRQLFGSLDKRIRPRTLFLLLNGRAVSARDISDSISDSAFLGRLKNAGLSTHEYIRFLQLHRQDVKLSDEIEGQINNAIPKTDPSARQRLKMYMVRLKIIRDEHRIAKSRGQEEEVHRLRERIDETIEKIAALLPDPQAADSARKRLNASEGVGVSGHIPSWDIPEDRPAYKVAGTPAAPVMANEPSLSNIAKAREAFEVLNSEIAGRANQCELRPSVARINGACQRLGGAQKLHLAVPIEVLRTAPDAAVTLTRLVRENQRGVPATFELIITGVREEDRQLTDNLKRGDVLSILGIHANINISTIDESEIAARLNSISDTCPAKTREGVIKDLFHEKNGTEELPGDEYLAIVTDPVTRDAAAGLASTLTYESGANVSICIVVQGDEDASMISFAQIVNQWFGAIKRGEHMPLVIDPILMPADMIRRLIQKRDAAIALLIAA